MSRAVGRAVSRAVSVPIDALAPTVGGRYEDPLVVVSADRDGRVPTSPGTVRTEHFVVAPVDGRMSVTHRVSPDLIDDDLAGLLVAELFGPGWLRGVDLFERIFTGVVRSVEADPEASWELFYRNTLRRLADEAGGRGTGHAHGSIAGYAPVYAHVQQQLAPGSVLELGCCFGFLSLLLARDGRQTVASDVSPGTVRLLSRMACRLGVRLDTVTADAARYPGPDGSADNVLVVHLLEHLDTAHGAQVLARAVQLAATRVVVAVPLEDEANEAYGHVRTVDLDDLRRWGHSSGLPFEVHDFHGGWLVLDVAAPVGRRRPRRTPVVQQPRAGARGGQPT